MIKDILVVLTVTSAIVVIGLALFNRPARSAEWAVLPPIEYDKPYANISIWEARDVYQVQEWCNCKELFTMWLAPDACTPASASSSSSRTKTSFDFVTHPNMSCAMSMDIGPNGWSQQT